MAAVTSMTLSLFQRVEAHVACPSLTGTVMVSLQVVHLDGDVAGFSVDDSQVALMNLQMALDAPLLPPPDPTAPPSQPSAVLIQEIEGQSESKKPQAEEQSTNALVGEHQLLVTETAAGRVPAESVKDKPSLRKKRAAPDDTTKTLQGSYSPIRSAFDLLRASSGQTLFSLLRDFQAQGLSGALTVVGQGEFWTFYLSKDGAITDFTGDIIGPLEDSDIIPRGLCPPGQATETTSSQLVRLDGSLRGDGIKGLPTREVKSVLLTSLVDRLDGLGHQSGAHYFFEVDKESAITPAYRLPFTVYGRWWLESKVGALTRDELEDYHQRRLTFFPVIRTVGSFQAPDIAKQEAEKRLVTKALPKGVELRSLLTFSPLNRRATYRLLMILEAFGVLRYERDQPLFAELDDVEGHLRARLSESNKGYYLALGVHPTSHDHDVDEALERLKMTYSSTGALSQYSLAAKSLCSEILSKAIEAKRYLSDRKRRMDYRNGLMTSTERDGYAQLLIDKMRLAALRGQQVEAARLRVVALELSPKVYRREMEFDDSSSDEP